MDDTSNIYIPDFLLKKEVVEVRYNKIEIKEKEIVSPDKSVTKTLKSILDNHIGSKINLILEVFEDDKTTRYTIRGKLIEEKEEDKQ